MKKSQSKPLDKCNDIIGLIHMAKKDTLAQLKNLLEERNADLKLLTQNTLSIMIDLKTILLIFSTLLVLSASSQNVATPKIISNDLTGLEVAFERIAKKILNEEKKQASASYYESQAHLQLLVSEFERAEVSMDNYVDTYTLKNLREGKIFIYRAYANAKRLQKEKNIDLKKAFAQSFIRLYSDLDHYLKPEINRNINTDQPIAEVRDEFLRLIRKYENQDSLSFSQAKALCEAFNKYKVYDEVRAQAVELLASEDEKIFDIEKDVVIPTENGGEVTALIIRKKGVKEKLPAIFINNIYAGAYDYEVAKRAAVYGYIGVAVNTRGKRLSKNAIAPFEFEGRDAYHIIEWIRNQTWCNGDVGMMGGSYLGFSQWAATKNLHPALKTIVPQVSVGIGIDYPMKNNVFMSYMLRWIHFVNNNNLTDPSSFYDNDKWEKLFDQWYEKGYSFRQLDSLLDGKSNGIFQRWLDHPGYDEYWKSMVPYKEEFKKINIPVLTTTGYYDADQMGAMYYFDQHHQHNPDAEHYLVIGPYSHSGGQHYASKTIGGYAIDSVAVISIYDLTYQWFDHILKKKEKPALLQDRVNYQIMGANIWAHCSSLEEMNSNAYQFYLSNITEGSNYQLSEKVMNEEGHILYEIDLSKRTKDDMHEFLTSEIVSKELNAQSRLTFVSKPLVEDVSLNGRFEGEIAVAINKKDMDVVMKLYEMRPDGSYFFLSDYMGRVSYAKNNEERELLTPNRSYTFPIKNSFMTSKKVSKGSRIVLLLGVNKSKHWEINYGSGKPVNQEDINDAGSPLLVKWSNQSYITIGYNLEE